MAQIVPVTSDTSAATDEAAQLALSEALALELEAQEEQDRLEEEYDLKLYRVGTAETNATSSSFPYGDDQEFEPVGGGGGGGGASGQAPVHRVDSVGQSSVTSTPVKAERVSGKVSGKARHEDAGGSGKKKAAQQKQAAPFVGIENQGATCYLNSLLQTLFHIGYFRNATFQIPTADEESPQSSIPLSLQVLFYHLQHKKEPGSTQLLTQSFGWSDDQAMVQHDVQELTRVLCDKLAEKMRGTPADKAIERLFVGSVINYTRCLDVDYTSSKRERFYDVQLTVSGHRDVYSSLDAYVAPEMLDEDNKYCVERDGQPKVYSRARRGVQFASFPPVLMLHLRRFELDFHTMRYQKINDRFEFPDELELDAYVDDDGDTAATNGKDSDAAAPDRTESLEFSQQSCFRIVDADDWHYTLYGVLVHSGDVNSGHYYGYLRPGLLHSQWYCFNDEDVRLATAREAVEDNYGGMRWRDKNGVEHVSPTNAYMLVYVRTSAWDAVVNPAFAASGLNGALIPPQVAQRLEQLAEEETRKWRLRDIVARSLELIVVTDEALFGEHDLSARDVFDRQQLEDIPVTPPEPPVNEPATFPTAGQSLTLNLNRPSHARFMVPNTATLWELHREAAAKLGLEPDQIRFWAFPRLTTAKFASQPSWVLEGLRDAPLADELLLSYEPTARYLMRRILFVEVARCMTPPTHGWDITHRGVAQQSSEAGETEGGKGLFPASNAVNALHSDPRLYSQTGPKDLQPWWQVTFPYPAVVTKVSLHNLPQEEVKGRLRDVQVELYSPDGDLTWRSPVLNPANSREKPAVIVVDLFALGVGPRQNVGRVRITRRVHQYSPEAEDPSLALQNVRVHGFLDGPNEESSAVLPPITDDDWVLVFVKQFLPHERRTRYLGTVVCDQDSPLFTLRPTLHSLAGSSDHTGDMLLFCEERAESITELDQCQTPRVLGVRTGFALVVQLLEEGGPADPPVRADHFSAFVLDQIAVEVSDVDAPCMMVPDEAAPNGTSALPPPSCVLRMSGTSTYAEIQYLVADAFNVGQDRASHLQFFGFNPYTERPRVAPESQIVQKTGQPRVLNDMLTYKGIKSRRIYFRLLDAPLNEWEAKVRITVEAFDASVKLVGCYPLVLPDDLPMRCPAGEVLQWVAQLQLGEQLRAAGRDRATLAEAARAESAQHTWVFFNVFDNYVYKIYDAEDPLPPKDRVYARDEWRADPRPAMLEGVPYEEQRLLPVCHINFDDPVTRSFTCHSSPFLFYISTTEKGAEVRDRIRQQLRIPKPQFAAWALYVMYNTDVYPVGEEDSVWDVVQMATAMLDDDDEERTLVHLAFEHAPEMAGYGSRTQALKIDG